MKNIEVCIEFVNHEPIPLSELEYESVEFLQSLKPLHDVDRVYLENLIEDITVNDIMNELGYSDDDEDED